MNANANIVSLKKGPSNLVRPKFSPGLLLRDDDLRTGVDYTRSLSRLLFRSLFGCGVVCGLQVSVRSECGKLIVTVNEGVALNGCGDPIHVPANQEIPIDPTCGEKIPAGMWVSLCRTEKCCAPRSAVCGCEEEDSADVCTREQEMFEIRIEKASLDQNGKLDDNAKPGKCRCICLPMTELPTEEQKKQRQAARAQANTNAAGLQIPSCACVGPCEECYKEHYSGECNCECCKDECVVLAYISVPDLDGQAGVPDMANAKANHSVRRFVRPVLMRDPVVWIEQNGGELCPKPDDAAIRQAKSKKKT